MEQYGKLKIIKELGWIQVKPSHKKKQRLVLAQCECGYEPFEYNYYNISSGRKSNCGCVKKLDNKSAHPLYNMFHTMKQRCYSKSSMDYSRYGGRGITIHQPWLEDIKTFFKWAENNGYSPGLKLEIDRIENEGPYSPDNCRWGTKAQNLANRADYWISKTHKGVRQYSHGQFEAFTKLQGQRVKIGIYKSADEAATARDQFLIDNKEKSQAHTLNSGISLKNLKDSA